MGKILYLISQPLDSQNYNRFGIQRWRDRGWEVEIWDLTPLAYPVVWDKFLLGQLKLSDFNGYYPLKTLVQLKDKISKLKGVKFFIDLAETDLYSICAIIGLKLRGAVRIIHATGSIPAYETSQGFRKRALLAWESGPKKMLHWFLSGCFRKATSRFITPGIGIAAGSESLKYVGESKKVIYAHNLDYDLYLKIKNSIALEKYYGVVFIDQNYCFHQDFDYIGVKSPVSPEKYFPAVRHALTCISEQMDTNVCVAIHPRSKCANNSNEEYRDIQIKRGITGQLINACQVVVAHDSTAVQLAVLFGKPIIFISTDELENAEVLFGYCKTLAKSLGKSPINIDKNHDQIDWKKEIGIDNEKYTSFRIKYIKTDGTPEMSSWDILIDHINMTLDRH